MVRITETSNISQYEKEKFKKKEDFLLVGKSDKSINIVSQGEKIDIKNLPIFNRTGTYNGVVQMDTNDIPLIIQYGVIGIEAGATKEVPFHSSFPNRCFQVQLTERVDTEATKLMADPVDATKFNLTSIGGVAGRVVSWFAIGF